MANFIICTDSAADLNADYVQERGIRVVPFYISFDGENYLKENIDLTQQAFYERLTDGSSAIPKTSCPSINDYMEVFENCLKEADRVVCICLSSKLSGSYQSACNAASEFNDGENRVLVVDSLLATAAQGLLVNEAVRMRRRKLTAEETVERLEVIKHTARVNFVIDDLTYLQKGGRIGKASALAGILFNIRPVIALKEGELFPVNKVRGRKKAAAEIKNLFTEEVKGHMEEYSFTALNFPQQGDIDGFCDFLVKPDIPYTAIGATIGSHVGITAAGIAYIKRCVQ